MKNPALLMVFFIICALCITPVSGQDETRYQVLILNSYNQGMPWTDSIVSGMEESLAGSGLNYELYIEYMDTKRIFNEEYLQDLHTLYKNKYSGRHFDIILCSDNDALDFLLEYRDELFPGTPVVFCGINYYSDDLIAGHDQFTGVVEDFDVRSTLNTALDLFPGTETVYIINDQTTTGRANDQTLDGVLPEFEERVNFVRVSNLSVYEIEGLTNGLGQGSLILLLTYNRDSEGTVFSYEEFGDRISRQANVPMFSVWDMYLDHGIVGGMVISGHEQGSRAGIMAVRILKGEPVSSVPVIKESPNSYMFDYVMLSRFGIPESALPPESVVINRPPSQELPVWVAYLGAGIILFMGAIVVVQHRNRINLQAEIKRRKTAEEELRQQNIEIRKAQTALRLSERRLTDIINFLPDATFAIDMDGRVIAWNRAIEEMTGFSAADMLGRGDHEYAVPFYGEKRPLLIDMMSEDSENIRSQYVNVRRNGNIIVGEAFMPGMYQGNGAHLWGIASPLYDNDGNIVGAIESLRDITRRKMARDALNRATKKLSLLSSITFSDIQNAVFSLSGYMELEKAAIQDGMPGQYLDKQIGIVRTITESLNFANKFQSLGLKPPAWQNVRQSFLIAISHLDVSKLSRTLDLEGLEIYADPLLEQVFFTLAQNVVLHGKTAKRLSLSFQESPDGLTLIFEDNGVGIPDDMKEKVFNRQFEADAGMGLFLAREILSITGIMIKENGEPGKGARFEITVPKSAYRLSPE